MKERYIFPAYFCYSEEGPIDVIFPDVPGCTSRSDNDEHAMHMAKEALALHLFEKEEKGEAVPEPTSVKELKPQPNQVVVLIEAFMPPFRERMNNKAVTKTVTIPRWMETEAKGASLNFSKILQDGIKGLLGSQSHHKDGDDEQHKKRWRHKGKGGSSK